MRRYWNAFKKEWWEICLLGIACILGIAASVCLFYSVYYEETQREELRDATKGSKAP